MRPVREAMALLWLVAVRNVSVGCVFFHPLTGFYITVVIQFVVRNPLPSHGKDGGKDAEDGGNRYSGRPDKASQSGKNAVAGYPTHNRLRQYRKTGMLLTKVCCCHNCWAGTGQIRTKAREVRRAWLYAVVLFSPKINRRIGSRNMMPRFFR